MKKVKYCKECGMNDTAKAGWTVKELLDSLQAQAKSKDWKRVQHYQVHVMAKCAGFPEELGAMGPNHEQCNYMFWGEY